MSAAPPNRQYGLVVADPPWDFANYSAKGEVKNPKAHYSCLPTPEICALGRALLLDFICAPNCVLALWATFPMLRDAFQVLDAWGFQYKSGGAWGKFTPNGKMVFGTGYIYRSAAELWIVGTRGAPRINNHSTRNLIDENYIAAPRREHSRKPQAFYDGCEAMFDGPYLEMFARTRRPGWEAWGNQVDKFGGAE